MATKRPPTDAGSGLAGNLWANPGNIFTRNGVFATQTQAGVGTHLWFSGFDMALPDDAQVIGFTMRIWRRASVAGAISDSEVRLSTAGIVPVYTGDSRHKAGTWGVTTEEAVYGGVRDLWGNTFTVAQINNANWGGFIACLGDGIAEARVDYVQLEVHWFQILTRLTVGRRR